MPLTAREAASVGAAAPRVVTQPSPMMIIDDERTRYCRERARSFMIGDADARVLRAVLSTPMSCELCAMRLAPLAAQDDTEIRSHLTDQLVNHNQYQTTLR